MGLFSRRRRSPLHIDDPRFEDWETVAEFEDVPTAGAFAGRLTELGIPNALTADEEGGDVFLQVPPDSYGDATVALDGFDL